MNRRPGGGLAQCLVEFFWEKGFDEMFLKASRKAASAVVGTAASTHGDGNGRTGSAEFFEKGTAVAIGQAEIG